MVEGQVVNVQEFVTEQKAVTAIIVHDGVNINEQVLQAGYGWVYKKITASRISARTG